MRALKKRTVHFHAPRYAREYVNSYHFYYFELLCVLLSVHFFTPRAPNWKKEAD
jgi:hypothetical protein